VTARDTDFVLPEWSRAVLRCPACRRGSLAPEAAGARCLLCGHRAAARQGVLDLLVAPHPAVSDEIRAVEAIDRGEAALGAAARPGGRGEGAREAVWRHIAATRRHIEGLLATHPPGEGAVLIELGADSCQATDCFLAAGARVVATDITDHLARAAPADPERLVRVRADMNRLPLHDGSADVVWSTAAAHHSWDLATTLREAARVLRPGGALVLCCEPMPGRLRHLLGWRAGAEERALGINETWIRRDRWLRLARDAGFAARIERPALDGAEIRDRLAARGLPGWLEPVVRPALRQLQVSVHLLGRRVHGR
jgi:SAM-dependent methyltransferase